MVPFTPRWLLRFELRFGSQLNDRITPLTTPSARVNTVNLMSTRLEILTEARELFVKRGLSGVSMRAVAEAVGVSATALYRHFNDKDALLAGLLGEAFSTFGSYLGRCLGGSTPLERFRLCGQAYVDFALEHRHDYELMFLTNCQDQGFDRVRHEVDQRSAPTFEILVDRVRECMEVRVFVERDAREASLFAWATLHGPISLWLLGQVKQALDEPALRQHMTLSLDYIELSLRSKQAPLRK
jgi:AcrR family transcriptional regulator